MKKQKSLIKKILTLLLLFQFQSACSEGCLSCTSSKKCSLCDTLENYSLTTESKCIKPQIEFCEYLSIQPNCLLCKTTHYPDKITGKCIEIEADKKIYKCLEQNENSCVKCEAGFYFGTISCEGVEKEIESCVVYKDKDTCAECGDGKVLGLEYKSCVGIEESDGGCAQYGFLDCEKCKNGFSLNFSYYILDIVNGDFAEMAFGVLRDVTEGKVNAEYYPVCQSNNIEKCVVYENSESCLECEDFFFVNEEKKCTAYPNDIIRNCEKYNSPTSCKVCKDGFHINNLKQCVENDFYFNCDVYDKVSLVTVCLKCTNDYYRFSATKCIERSNKVINNCVEYSLFSDQCKICAPGFTTTSDGLKCLEVVENCESYETSTVSDIKLICIICETEHFLNSDSICEKGTTNDCELYEIDEDICVKCINKSYLNTQKNCLKHKAVSNCTSYSFTEENECDECDNETLLFGVEKMCKPAEKITGCETYLSEDECNKCSEKYFKNIKTCVLIDEALNCLTMENSLCTKCKPGYLIESGLCKLSLTYIEQNCSLSNSITGTQTRNTLQCDHCSENTIPLYYTNYFLCHTNEWINTIVGDSVNTSQCLQIDKVGGAYKCRICENPFYNNNGVCSDSCNDGTPNSFFELVKDGDDFYSVEKTHFCGTSQNVTGCEQFSPIVVSHSGTFANKCNKCLDGFLTIIDKIGFGSYKDAVPIKDIDLSVNKGFLENPVSFFPVNKQCKHNTDVSITFVENCEYYTILGGFFKCFKCKHGRTGMIKDDPLGGYITSCPDSDCSNQFVYGLSSELNSMLSCHLCSSNKIPFLFGKGGTTYTSITDIKAYDITNKTAGELDNVVTGGITVECLLLSDSKLNIVSPNLPDFCAIAFYNVESDVQTITTPSIIPLMPPTVVKYLSAQHANKRFDVDATKIAIFCLACERGKRPLKSTSDSASNPTPAYLPYMVGECETIQNCKNSEWFNYCSECADEHIYEYIVGKGVDYASCVSFNEDPNCYSAVKEGNFFSCQICDAGFYKNSDGVCEVLKPPMCEGFEREIKFKDYDIRTYLFLNPLGKGCTRCKEGFKALKIEEQVHSCTFSSYISIPVLPRETKFIFKCQKYFIEGINFKCKFCTNGYVVSSNDIECFEEGELPNCKKALTSTKCYICEDTHITVDGICYKKELPNCKVYEKDNFLTKQVCIGCEEKYYLKDGKCFPGEIDNCSIYNYNAIQCKTCEEGYIRVNDKNGLPYCFNYDKRINCKLLDETKFHRGIISCLECLASSPFFPSTTEIDRNFCSPFTKIEKCLRYDINLLFNDSAFHCLLCEPDYYSLLTTCELRINKDPNCIEFNPFEDQCIDCADQHYVSPNGKNCLTNPLGVPGCLEYLSAKECITCKAQMYLSEKECVFITASQEIPNCLYYDDETTCRECRSGYLIENKLCKQALAKNCFTYESIKQCASCFKGKGLKEEEGGITNCVSNEDDKCVDFDQKIYPFVCKTCIQGFFADVNGNCAKASVDIDSCLVYDSKDSCEKCELGFILNPDRKSCVNNIYTSAFLDSNCEETVWRAEPFCKVCKGGFFLDLEKNCEKCEANGCFFCDSFQPSVCYLCMSGFYMDEEGGCISMEKAVVVVEEFVGLMVLYGGLVLMFL